MIWWCIAAYITGVATVVIVSAAYKRLINDKELLVYLKRKIEKRLRDDNA